MEAQNCLNFAQKLGIRNPSVIRQAEELLRLTEVRRQSLTGLNLPSSCKAILCLELAAGLLEQPCDKSLAQKLSGVNKKIYSSNFKALERVLDLHTKSSVRELAVQFGCTEAVELAQRVLMEYQNDNMGNEMDFKTALFQGASLLVAAKKSKVKIDRVKLTGLSGTKKSVFDKLVTDMEKICEKLETKGKENSVKAKRQKSFLDTLQDYTESEKDIPSKVSKMKDDEKTQVDDYEQWKKRILENARKQLANST